MESIIFSKHGSYSKDSQADALLLGKLRGHGGLLLKVIILISLVAWFDFGDFKLSLLNYVHVLRLVALMVHYLIAQI